MKKTSVAHFVPLSVIEKLIVHHLSLNRSPARPPSNPLAFTIISSIQGFAAAHELVMDTLSNTELPHGLVSIDEVRTNMKANVILSPESTTEESSMFAAIVDHDAGACRLCLAKNSAHGSTATATSAGVSGMGGASVSASPRIWVRLGAADSSSHGEDFNKKNDNVEVRDPVMDAFFPPPASQSRANSGLIGDQSPAQRSEGAAQGEGVTGGTGVGAGGLFKAGGMFRGMNIDMSKMNVGSMTANMNSLFKVNSPLARNGTSTAVVRTDSNSNSPDSNNATDATTASPSPCTTTTTATATTTTDSNSSTGENAALAPTEGPKEAEPALSTPSWTGSGDAAGESTGPVGGTGSTADLASKIRMSFGRFSVRSDAKSDGQLMGGGGEEGTSVSGRRDSGGFGLLLRKVSRGITGGGVRERMLKWESTLQSLFPVYRRNPEASHWSTPALFKR